MSKKNLPAKLSELDLKKLEKMDPEDFIAILKDADPKERGEFYNNMSDEMRIELENRVKSSMEKTVSWIHRRMPEMIHLTALAEPKIELSCPVAATDGKTIYFGAGFLGFSPTKKNRSESGSLHTNMGDACFVVLHEFFHVAYSHPWRMLIAMQRSNKPFSMSLWNVVADVMINSRIMQIPYRPAKPDNGMFQDDFDKLLSEWQGKTPEEDLPDELINPSKHAILRVHDALLALPNAPKKSDEQQSGQPQKGKKGGKDQGKDQKAKEETDQEGEGEGEGEPSEEAGDKSQGKGGKSKQKSDLEGSGEAGDEQQDASGSGSGGGDTGDSDPDEEFEKDVQSELQRILGKESGDLRLPESGEYDENNKREQENRKALQRVADSCKARGINPGKGILDQEDIEPVPYPWQRIIAPLLTRNLIRSPGIDHRKPSRGMISSSAAFPNTPIPFEAGYGDWTEGGRLAILIDTSGSIDDGTLKHFLGHMVTILKVIASPCDLIAGDTQVNLAMPNIELENDIAKSVKGKISGRGGTEFKPLIDKAVEFQADIALYLTDGYAPFPPQPRNMLMIWAVTSDGLSPQEFPYGIVVTVQ